MIPFEVLLWIESGYMLHVVLALKINPAYITAR